MKMPYTVIGNSPSEILDYLGLDLIRGDEAGSLYPPKSRKWWFHDGSMGVCQPWNYGCYKYTEIIEKKK